MVVNDAGWTASGYAVLLFCSSLAGVAAVAAQPSLERGLGPFRPAIVACGVAGFCSLFTFGGVLGNSPASAVLFGALVPRRAPQNSQPTAAFIVRLRPIATR